MTKDEALKRALSALEAMPSDEYSLSEAMEIGSKAITAIKEALAQPQQEPVLRADPFTYVIQHLNSNPYNMTKNECITHIKKLRDLYNEVQP